MKEDRPHIYIAVGQNIWAKGFTPRQALDGLKQESAQLAKAGYILYACYDPWAYIDGMGDINYVPIEGVERMYWEVERKDNRRKRA